MMHRYLLVVLVLVLFCASCSSRNAIQSAAPGLGAPPDLAAAPAVPPDSPRELPEIVEDKAALSLTRPEPPRATPHALAGEQSAPLSPHLFVLHCGTGSIVAKGEYDRVMTRVAALLRQHPRAVARIMGHTDNQGMSSNNLKLSLRRAENIRFMLSRDYDLSLDRLQALGYGETFPMQDNRTPGGRAANRRVEIAVALPEQAGALQPLAASRETPHTRYASAKASATAPVSVLPQVQMAQSPAAGRRLELPETPTLAPQLFARREAAKAPSQAAVTYTPLPVQATPPVQTASRKAEAKPAPSRIGGRYSPSRTAAADSAPRFGIATSSRGIEIVAVGDIMMGSTWPRTILPPNDGADLFSHVAPLFRGADLVFGNLEGPLIDGGRGRKCAAGSSSCYEFRMPTRYVRHLQRAGFNAVSIANNHARDFGSEGQQSTVETLRAAGIAPVGGESVGYLTLQGRRVAVIGFAHRGGPYSHPIQNLQRAQELVRQLSRENDLVVVSFHGGAEGSGASHVPSRTEYFLGENRGDVRAFAHAVIDAGADLVLGHGPHVLRAMERYKGRLIAYSLGNFLTYELFSTRGPCGQSVVLRATLDPDTGEFMHGKLTPVQLTHQGLPRLDTTLAATRQIMQLSSRLAAEDSLRFTAGIEDVTIGSD